MIADITVLSRFMVGLHVNAISSIMILIMHASILNEEEGKLWKVKD